MAIKIQKGERRTDITDGTFSAYFWHDEKKLVFDCQILLTPAMARQLSWFMDYAAKVLEES